MGTPKSLNAVSREDKIVACPECGSKDIGYKDGERYCKKCGLILD